MAPECLSEGVFSTRSDVYSFGILCWEVFTLGAVPFAAFPGKAVVQAIISGQRPTKPHLCPDNVFALMSACWRVSERPTFQTIHYTLDKIITSPSSEATEEAVFLACNPAADSCEGDYVEIRVPSVSSFLEPGSGSGDYVHCETNLQTKHVCRSSAV